MKIVHVLLGDANPGSMNGVNKVVHHIATEQHRSGHEVEVWGLHRSLVGDEPVARDYRFRPCMTATLPHVLLRVFRERVEELDRETWVQMHSVFVPEYRLLSATLFRRGIAFGLTPHGGYSPFVLAKSRFKKIVYLRLVEMPILRRASLLHAIGETEVEGLRRLVPRANVVLVANGQSPIDPCSRSASSYEDDRPIFSFCGRLDIRHKGLDLMLEGFARYCSDDGRGTLWLIGDGTDRPACETLVATYGLKPRVRFLGVQYGSDKVGLLMASDAFLHTSRWEGMPTAVLEAAASGLPLLVSRETNLARAVITARAGLVLPTNTPEAIAQGFAAMAAACADGSARAIGERAASMVAEHFAWPAIARRLTGEFQKALEGRGESRRLSCDRS